MVAPWTTKRRRIVPGRQAHRVDALDRPNEPAGHLGVLHQGQRAGRPDVHRQVPEGQRAGARRRRRSQTSPRPRSRSRSTTPFTSWARVGGRDQQRVAGVDDDHVVEPEHGDHAVAGRYDEPGAVLHHHRRRVAQHPHAARRARQQVGERAEVTDVVPAEAPGHDRDPTGRCGRLGDGVVDRDLLQRGPPRPRSTSGRPRSRAARRRARGGARRAGRAARWPGPRTCRRSSGSHPTPRRPAHAPRRASPRTRRPSAPSGSRTAPRPRGCSRSRSSGLVGSIPIVTSSPVSATSAASRTTARKAVRRRRSRGPRRTTR